MTTLLYQTDSYLHSFNATIVELAEEDHGIILDQTAFYPGGGGQPPDFGKFIANWVVVKNPSRKSRLI